MAFIRIKTIKNVKYYYLVESVREGGKVKQKIVRYFGTTLPDGYVPPTKASVVRKEAIKKAPEILNLRLTRGPGGNFHPIAVKQFILDRLAAVGEDYISGMHQAYKDALDRLAEQRHRVYYYHHPTYESFRRKVWLLIEEGALEFSGREEEASRPYLADRRYYRLKR